MKELQYPFDEEFLMSNKRRIKRMLVSENSNYIEKKIAILGGSTTSAIKDILELFLLNNGIQPIFYESEYNQYFEDALFSNPSLDEFYPDVIYLCTSVRNIIDFPRITDSENDVTERLLEVQKKFTSIWDSLSRRFSCPIIQNNFELPTYRLMGNYDVVDVHGATNFVHRLNAFFSEKAASSKGLYICDLNYISADFGLKNWHDSVAWYMYKYAMNLSAIPTLAFNVANIIKAFYGRNKKGYVVDLDNTLWGGVIGDVGVEGIVLGQETSEGQAYIDFQRYLKLHKQMGIILNIDSKNNEDIALTGLAHPESELHTEDFIEIRANWNSKDKNFIDIANSLNLAPESLVFIDDNPAERFIVSEQLWGVVAPEMSLITDYISILDHSGFFETVSFSQDDIKRDEMYKVNKNRVKLESNFAEYGDYLKALEMKAFIKPFEHVYMTRIAQLTNKSNQFNLTTRRFTREEIEEITNSDKYITLYGKLEDKFGDNGVVAIAIGQIKEDTVCEIVLWLMSCRVLKRDMECAMMDQFVDMCKKRGVKSIRGIFIPTVKNKMVAEFYKDRGFKLTQQNPDGQSEWVLNLESNYTLQNKFIEIGD